MSWKGDCEHSPGLSVEVDRTLQLLHQHVVVGTRQNDEGDMGCLGLRPKEGIQPLLIGQTQVQEDDIGACLIQMLQSLAEPRGVTQLKTGIGGLLQHFLKQTSISAIVLDQENLE